MAWGSGDPRTSTAQWRRTTDRVKRRDGYRCTWVENGARCDGPADEVDHVVEVSEGGTDADENLRSLCADHHRRKTAAHANLVRWRHRRQRPDEPHPGMVDDEGGG